MDEYIVVPWDHLGIDPETGAPIETGIVLEQYVPPELEALAYKVMEQYDMTVSDMRLITSKPDKGGAIWRIETNKGPRSIKVLHRTPQRSLFSVGAQQHLVQQGARVPSLIPTIDESLYVEAGGKLWIVTEWIDTLIPASKIDLEGAVALCQGLGEFHQWSKDYLPPHGAAKSSRLYGWPKNYQKIIAKISWFRHIADAYPETAGSSPLLRMVDEFERQAIEMLDRLNASAYSDMVMMGETYWGLAHQDYGWSNGQMGPGGIWVIDLDGVAYDLPFRDLRKLITSTMADMGTWDITWIRGMIEGYNRGNPLTQEMFDILWIDMAFPSEFYKHVKEMVYDPIAFMEVELPAILQLVEMTEINKWQVLQELLQDRDQYPLGNYVAELETSALIIEVPDSNQLIDNGDPVAVSDPDPTFDPLFDLSNDLDPIQELELVRSESLTQELNEDPLQVDPDPAESTPDHLHTQPLNHPIPLKQKKLQKKKKKSKVDKGQTIAKSEKNAKKSKTIRHELPSALKKQKNSSSNKKLNKAHKMKKKDSKDRLSITSVHSKPASRKLIKRSSSKLRNQASRSISTMNRSKSNRKMA